MFYERAELNTQPASSTNENERTKIMTWYLNRGGNHVGRDGKTYANGEMLQDTLDLESMFPAKFQRVDPPAEIVAQLAAVAAPVATPEPAANAEVDVTDEFPGAKEAGFRVLQTNNKGKVAYNIFDGEDETPPLNEKPLTGPQTTKKLIELGVEAPQE